MSERCEPPEGWRERDGWHWLTECNPVLWIAERQEWEWGEDDWVTPDAAYRYGYRYLSPVATPAEVAALRAEVARLREALDRAAVVAEGASTCPIFRDEKWVTQPDAVARRCAAAIRAMKEPGA
jgi:hypothetical protein